MRSTKDGAPGRRGVARTVAPGGIGAAVAKNAGMRVFASIRSSVTLCGSRRFTDAIAARSASTESLGTPELTGMRFHSARSYSSYIDSSFFILLRSESSTDAFAPAIRAGKSSPKRMRSHLARAASRSWVIRSARRVRDCDNRRRASCRGWDLDKGMRNVYQAGALGSSGIERGFC